MPFFRSLYNRPAFKRDQPTVGASQVVLWWECRRLFFNLAVFLTGIVSCVLLIICGFCSEQMVGEAIGLPDGPLLGVFAIFSYGLLANVFYTSGWICELFSRGIVDREKASAFGILAFRAGVTFSVALTRTPALVCWAAFAIALAHGQTHGPLPE